MDLLLAKLLGSRIQIEYQERRVKSRRKNAATIVIAQTFTVTEYKGTQYLLDKRVTDRRRSVH
jgi:hypothetical protein